MKLCVRDRLIEVENESDGVNVRVRVRVGTCEGDLVKVGVIETLLLKVDEIENEWEMETEEENVNEGEMVCDLECDGLNDVLEDFDVVVDEEINAEKDLDPVADRLQLRLNDMEIVFENEPDRLYDLEKE